MIHHVQLACPPGSEDRSRAFYIGLLGLTELAKPPALAARGDLDALAARLAAAGRARVPGQGERESRADRR